MKNIKYKKSNSGFTLAELLIVVAIISVLIAIAIVVVPNALTKSKNAKDEATLRIAYSEGLTCMLSGNDTVTKGVYKAKVNLSADYTSIRVFGDLHFADKSPTYMPSKNITYIDGVPYLNKNGVKGKKYIIVRVLPDGTVGYEGLANHSHHPDSYYDKIYNS